MQRMLIALGVEASSKTPLGTFYREPSQAMYHSPSAWQAAIAFASRSLTALDHLRFVDSRWTNMRYPSSQLFRADS